MSLLGQLILGLLLAGGEFSPAAPARFPAGGSRGVAGPAPTFAARAAQESQPGKGTPTGRTPTTGTIQGRVTFQGSTIPRPTEIENTTDPEECGSRQSFLDLLISPQNRGIQNVIVTLADAGLPPLPRPPAQKLVLDNRKCQFAPHVGVVTAGSTIEATNSDPISHTTHLYYGPLSRNLALAPGEKASQLVSRPGLIIVKCDIHGWMKAYVRVDSHPFHAVSDAAGRFEIPGVPPGSYTLMAWHETLGEQKLAVTVRAGKAEAIEIQYRK